MIYAWKYNKKHSTLYLNHDAASNTNIKAACKNESWTSFKKTDSKIKLIEKQQHQKRNKDNTNTNQHQTQPQHQTQHQSKNNSKNTNTNSNSNSNDNKTPATTKTCSLAHAAPRLAPRRCCSQRCWRCWGTRCRSRWPSGTGPVRVPTTFIESISRGEEHRGAAKTHQVELQTAQQYTSSQSGQMIYSHYRSWSRPFRAGRYFPDLHDLYDLLPLHDLNLSGQIGSWSVWSVWSAWSVWSSSWCRVGSVQSASSRIWFPGWICATQILHNISQRQVGI